VSGIWVSKLEKIRLYYSDEKNKAIILDFTDVTFIDMKGVRMLENIKDERVRIINCSQFIRLLICNLIISNSNSLEIDSEGEMNDKHKSRSGGARLELFARRQGY
jgi:hypothetical protein